MTSSVMAPQISTILKPVHQIYQHLVWLWTAVCTQPVYHLMGWGLHLMGLCLMVCCVYIQPVKRLMVCCLYSMGLTIHHGMLVVLNGLINVSWCAVYIFNRLNSRGMLFVLNRFNSLAPGGSGFNIKNATFNPVLLIAVFRLSYDNAPRRISWDISEDKSALVQVVAWCHQATSH